jgi:hypothetical protein
MQHDLAFAISLALQFDQLNIVLKTEKLDLFLRIETEFSQLPGVIKSGSVDDYHGIDGSVLKPPLDSL